MRDARIVEDVHHLAGMQLVVDRNRHALRGPNPEQQFNDLRTVLAGDRDPCAGRVVLPDRARQAQRTGPQLAPGAAAAPAVIHRAAIGKALRGLVQQREQVHRGVHSEVNAILRQILRRTPATVDHDGLPVDETAARRTQERHGARHIVDACPAAGAGSSRFASGETAGSCNRSSVIGVWITPGATALQRMPCAPYWQAMWVVNAVSPPLAAEYGAPAQSADDGERRRDVDDGRAGLHVRHHVTRQPERGAQHHVEEVVQCLVVGFVQRVWGCRPRRC